MLHRGVGQQLTVVISMAANFRDLTRNLGKDLRKSFDAHYDSSIIGGGFVESDDYYRVERERYWRSLQLLGNCEIQSPASILEIGGGQLALLRKKLFGDHTVVADVNSNHISP